MIEGQDGPTFKDIYLSMCEKVIRHGNKTKRLHCMHMGVRLDLFLIGLKRKVMYF